MLVVLFGDGANILITTENGQIIQQKVNKDMNDLHLLFYADIITEKTLGLSF
jgi:hypothetical protein